MDSMAKKKKLDVKWIELIKEAKTIGLTQEEVRLFLISAQRDS